MNNFIGHKDIIDRFNKRADKGKLSHAHLIVGADGTGKSIIANKFAIKMLGKSEEKNYVDIIKYSPEKASFGVDDVRAIIQEVGKKPYEGDKKVIIIYNGEKLTVQAQNALLKTIEEPPKGVFIIILSQTLEVMLDTIKSRCQIYKLTPISKKEMIQYIDTLDEPKEERKLAALAYGNGIPGRAERFLKDEKLTKLRCILIELIKDVTSNENIILKYEKELENFKDEKEEILNILVTFIRDIIIYKEMDNRDSIINLDKISEISALSNLISYKKLNKMLEAIDKARVNILENTNYSMIISVMLINFLEG